MTKNPTIFDFLNIVLQTSLQSLHHLIDTLPNKEVTLDCNQIFTLKGGTTLRMKQKVS